MKTSLKKLRGFALRHSEHKERKDLRPLSPVDELAQASQDMEDMRDCYDVFLSSAAATANSAFEFSEALREMGSCLLEKTALNDDEESGKVLLMLGKVQFQLQKLVDRYRSHIFQTITVPSESLLNELRTVEEMKQQCDEKRDVYENMMMRQREKGRGRSGKAETFSMHQIQEAHDEYDAEATLFIFRMKSLKEGQSRSLLTQAARHHAAQLCFFKKAVKALEALEPHLKLVTEQQHIDYHFSGLEDGDGDDDFYDDGEDDGDTDDGELSFDYGQNDQEQNVSTSANSTELDLMDVTFPRVAMLEASKGHQDTSYRKSFSLKGDVRTNSQSAPLFANIIYDTAERMRQMQPSLSKKFNSYVLPTPVDTKSSNSTGSVSLVTPTLKTDLNGQRQDAWHSSPLEPKKSLGEKFPASTVKMAESVLKENNRDADSNQPPPPLADILFISRFDPPTTTDSKKIKRYAFSGPITGKAGANKSVSAEATGLFSSGPIKSKVWPYQSVSTGTVGLFSGPLMQNPVTQVPSSSPKVSPTASPPFMSSPIISELHELPRPPSSSTSKSSGPLSLIGHSAPLIPKNYRPPTSTTSLEPHSSSPLPVPSQAISRSFSTPSSNLKAMAMDIAKPLEATRNLEKIEDMASLPLTSISLSNVQLSSTTQEITQTGQ